MLGRSEGWPTVKIILNNGVDLSMLRDGWGLHVKKEKGVGVTAHRVTPTELKLCRLVRDAYATYFEDGDQESMSYAECAAADALVDRIDWEALGFVPEEEPGERSLYLCDTIAHFEDLAPVWWDRED